LVNERACPDPDRFRRKFITKPGKESKQREKEGPTEPCSFAKDLHEVELRHGWARVSRVMGSGKQEDGETCSETD
jgi:hypothetical protein